MEFMEVVTPHKGFRLEMNNRWMMWKNNVEEEIRGRLAGNEHYFSIPEVYKDHSNLSV